MGSNIFYPFTKNRTPGLQWMHSGDGLPNFLTVWISCILIFWNLHRAIPEPTYHFSLLHLLMVCLLYTSVNSPHAYLCSSGKTISPLNRTDCTAAAYGSCFIGA